MKKILLLIMAVVLMALSSCHQPEFIETTADRQGLTSLTAIFTFGPYVDQELAKLVIEDDQVDRFVIPIPFYYPETSDDETLFYMTKVRVQAELQPNYSLSPALTILDLTEENHFKYTDPHGNSRDIVITGERVKMNACELMAFSIVNPPIVGIINKEAKTVTLPTKDDLSSCKATVQLSPHATIAPDPSKARNYNNPVKFIVTADDGTEAEYTVMTGDPEKIDMGFNASSIEKLFNIDPVTRLGLPPYSAKVAVSLAALENNLVICLGDGSVPMYINRLNGEKLGTIKLGNAVPGSITNDEMEHMLITNVAKGGDDRETVNIYRTSSVKTDPVLFYSFENPIDCPIGNKMKVFGDIDGDAIITFTACGIEGVTTTAKAVYLTVSGGQVVSTDVIDMSGFGFGWGAAPVNTATIVPASLAPAQDGWFVDYYESNADADGNYLLHYILGSSDTVVARIGSWANNPNCLDSKGFNNCRYMALFVVSHFPQWGTGPMLYLFNVTDPASPVLELSNESIAWYQTGTSGVAAGDVVISPSADGYKVYIYYYDHNSQAVGGYVADCIKR